MRLAALFALAALSAPQVAFAELSEEASRVKTEAEAEGALSRRLPSVFLENRGTFVFEPLQQVPAQDACVTVIVLGSRTTQFDVTSASTDGDKGELFGATSLDKRTVSSTEGLFSRTACRGENADIARLLVRMRSARGALEIIVARSGSPLKAEAALVARRAPGPAPARPDMPSSPPPVSAEERLKEIRTREKKRGSEKQAVVAMQSGETGSGEFDLKLSAGCHDLDVVAETSEALDLDAELRSADGNFLYGEDRGESADAHLEACIPVVTSLALRFSGAGPNHQVSVSDGLFAWPTFVSDTFGTRAASALAWIFRSENLPRPRGPATTEMLGGQGTTITRIEVEPGHCYVAALALTKGDDRGTHLSVRASARAVAEGSSSLLGPAVVQEGSAVVFCAESEEKAEVRIDVPSASATWLLSVWPLTSDR